MSRLKKLKEATTLTQFAPLIGFKAGMLSYLLYIKPKKDLYRKFDIPKRHGGVRQICAPECDLKLAQHRLSVLLQECYREVNLLHGHIEGEGKTGISHGFKKYHTIMTNGRVHVTRRYVFNVDLHDFFGSINFGRVRGFFIKNKNFKLNSSVATVIAQIACYENKLPQGSPCSPVISNLIGHSLDVELVKLAARESVSYSRYVDDLTFSTNRRDFPACIAEEINGHEWDAGRKLNKTISRSGFLLNPSKTRMQYKDSRQEVTGLTVNRKVNVPATYRYTVRAMVDHLFKTGKFDFIYKKKSAAGSVVVNKEEGKRNQLLGMLSYIDQVDLFNEKLRKDNDLVPVSTIGRQTIFRRFLYFDNFYAIDEPIVVCEGKTDNIYLRCAIKSLASFYPELASQGNPTKLKIRFFKYSERRTSSVLELGGGVGGICKLLKNYHEDVRDKFKAPPPNHPVIVMIDNDSGADKVYGAISGITKKKKPEGRADFIHVTSNLYVVPTPFLPGFTNTSIEDFFDATTLATILNGKGFNRSNEMDGADSYGKTAFAINVVARQSNSINFVGFKIILDRFVKVIEHYKTIKGEV